MSNYSVIAYDTETCQAQLRVLASSNENFIKFAQDKYTINDIPSVLDFLFNEGKKAKYNVETAFHILNTCYRIICRFFVFSLYNKL